MAPADYSLSALKVNRPRLERLVGCVVREPWGNSVSISASMRRALINPANEALIGTARPYFPRGGPVPSRPPKGLETSSSGWGGMDAGSRMLYPAQVVDGLVHQHGGRALRDALVAAAPVLEEVANGEHVRCRVGDAILTAAPPSLPFDVILHTPPPFFPSDSQQPSSVKDWESQLASCYISALRLAALSAAQAGQDRVMLATPLLGAGARGAPTREAARVLVHAFQSPQALEATPDRIKDVLVRVVVADDQSDRELLAEMMRAGRPS